MKTFVKAKADYKNQLLGGEYYELVGIVETKAVRSGKAVVIFLDDGDLDIFDSGFFE